ncbi:MAG: hypothetical protein V1917_00255 [Candidatus Gottesmanbacteria bacterium]
MKLTHVNFIVLFIILFSGIWTFWGAQNDKVMQMYIGVATAIAYVSWGMIYHSLEGDLHPKVVVEYCLVGAIAIVLLLTILWT